MDSKAFLEFSKETMYLFVFALGITSMFVTTTVDVIDTDVALMSLVSGFMCFVGIAEGIFPMTYRILDGIMEYRKIK